MKIFMRFNAKSHSEKGNNNYVSNDLWFIGILDNNKQTEITTLFVEVYNILAQVPANVGGKKEF